MIAFDQSGAGAAVIAQFGGHGLLRFCAARDMVKNSAILLHRVVSWADLAKVVT